MAITVDCSTNLHEYCDPCICPCHGITLNPEEIRALCRVLEHQYINYEDTKAHETLTRLFNFERHELAGADSRPT